jgi:leucyl/phenylalanyl-tRNA--protein transferase
MATAVPEVRFWQSPLTAGADGLVGVGGDLRPAALLTAYADGVFPWFNAGDPVLWWSPDPRGVIELPAGLHVSRSLRRVLNSGRFTVTVNTAFSAVMAGCGEGRDGGTWVTPDMLAAYHRLHRMGHAHSVEVWEGSDLVGGTYGVAVGGLFAAESMFHRATDAGKVALVGLRDRLVAGGFTLWDVQIVNDHTATLGAVEMPRREYLRRLRAAVAAGAHFPDRPPR